MNIVDEVVRSVLSILEECEFQPADSEKLLIDTHMSHLTDDERDEVDMLISAKVMMTRAQATVG